MAVRFEGARGMELKKVRRCLARLETTHWARLVFVFSFPQGIGIVTIVPTLDVKGRSS